RGDGLVEEASQSGYDDVISGEVGVRLQSLCYAVIGVRRITEPSAEGKAEAGEIPPHELDQRPLVGGEIEGGEVSCKEAVRTCGVPPNVECCCRQGQMEAAGDLGRAVVPCRGLDRLRG